MSISGVQHGQRGELEPSHWETKYSNIMWFSLNNWVSFILLFWGHILGSWLWLSPNFIYYVLKIENWKSPVSLFVIRKMSGLAVWSLSSAVQIFVFVLSILAVLFSYGWHLQETKWIISLINVSLLLHPVLSLLCLLRQFLFFLTFSNCPNIQELFSLVSGDIKSLR